MVKHLTQLRDLYRCLDDYPMVMLQALARSWCVTAITTHPHELIECLIKAMQTPAMVNSVIEALSPIARQALLVLMRNPEGTPSHRLVVTYGQIRKLGPARIEREEPWLKPQAPLEELYYRGFIYRAYGKVGSYYGEVLWIPWELANSVASLGIAQPLTSLKEVKAPIIVASDENIICDDIVAILVKLRKSNLPTSRQGLRQSALPWEELQIKARMQGGLQPERLTLLQDIAWRLQLISAKEGSLKPGSRARTWMRLDALRRLSAIYIAWRDNPHRNELRYLANLEIETHTPVGMVNARRAICTHLAAYQPGVWTRIDTFIAALRNTHPDFLRPDGDYDTWVVHNTQTGQKATGFSTWDMVEGSLASNLVLQPLYWLGILMLGTSKGSVQADLFRLTPEGWAVMNHQLQEQVASAQVPLTAIIDDDFLVTLPVEGTLYERYQLERLTEWLSQDKTARFRITEESIWESINSGITMEQILRFLERISAGQISPAVLRALHAWGGRFGRVSLQAAVILQVADVELMAQLENDPTVRHLLGVEVSPTQRLVPGTNIPQLVQRLKSLGIWPSLKL
jgi:hypothetical protein